MKYSGATLAILTALSVSIALAEDLKTINGANLARIYIVFAAGLLVAEIASLTLIARELRKAPEGYEDEHGFHIVRKFTGLLHD